MKKMTRKTICAFIILICCMGCAFLFAGCFDSNTVSQHRVDDSFEKKKNTYEYKIKDDGTIELNGYRGDELPEVLIPESIEDIPVTEIGDYAYEGVLDKFGITEITIPSSVFILYHKKYSHTSESRI